jgi:glycosidase
MSEPTYYFHISRQARARYGFSPSLYSSTGNVVFMDLHAASVFTQRVNQVRQASGETGVEPVRAGDMNAMGLIDEILHYVAGLFRKQADPLAFSKALVFAERRCGRDAVDGVLQLFAATFPAPVADGAAAGPAPAREVALEEFLLLALANENPAFRPFLELFDYSELCAHADCSALMDAVQEFFRAEPVFGPDSQDLVTMLKSPMRAAPLSLAGQLEYIRTRWGALLGDMLLRLLTGIDVLREEEKLRFGAFTPGPPEVYEYVSQAAEIEAFSADTEWMPRVVMMAKNALVWLDQLSRAYGREVRRLDQVPDEELDRLGRAGFTSLWLIGVWERSPASREIKRRMGNPDAEASAYSLYDYVVAAELGGQGALDDLRARAARRGIRLASDMVPNHTGVDSRWMAEHPERFLAWPHPWPPFPSYSFNDPNISSVPGVGVYLEDHYWNKSDAAVVFKRVDFASGDTRFLYHGNDGTHMPWNDTAQLDFLNPETREAVIQTILRVAHMFPIIRFDAAMTLAKKHFQRLWFPEPGKGGDIPSRAGNGLSRHDFDKAMPVEFWREVVDRVAREAPGTLLLAEAFWLLEGFFVRTLGMHRVYNSAFMHMLKAEDNAGYRQTLRNTLEFDPEVLKRFVNFMSNPDEQTAIEQFGDGDKYFGVCTLMATLPGLPMFAHGQLEGFREKYGMEFRRAYWNEQTSANLVARHEREIFPLLRRRHIFSGVESFLLYDFFAAEGGVNENVFAYSNRSGEERGLVLFNNRYAEARGWVKTSAAFAVKTGAGKSLVQKCLAEGLALPNDPSAYAVFREHVSGLQYVRNCRELWEKGLYAELPAFACSVFLDFAVVSDDGRHMWSRLCGELSGRGVPSMDATLREMELRPVREPFARLVGMQGKAAESTGAFEDFLRAAAHLSNGRIDGELAMKDFVERRELFAQAALEPGTARAFLWLWTLLRPLCGPAEGSGQGLTLESWVREWMLSPITRDFLVQSGWQASAAERFPVLLAVFPQTGEPTRPAQWRSLVLGEEAARFLQVNEFEGVKWFSKEAFQLLVECMEALAKLSSAQPRAAKTQGAHLLKAAEESGYRWDALVAALQEPARRASAGPRRHRPTP